jgi:hypothetical protein
MISKGVHITSPFNEPKVIEINRFFNIVSSDQVKNEKEFASNVNQDLYIPNTKY